MIQKATAIVQATACSLILFALRPATAGVCGSTCQLLQYNDVVEEEAQLTKQHPTNVVRLYDGCGNIQHKFLLGTDPYFGSVRSFIQFDGTIIHIQENATVYLYDVERSRQLFRCHIPGSTTYSGRPITSIDMHNAVKLTNGNILLQVFEEFTSEEVQQLGVPPNLLAAKQHTLPLLLELTPTCESAWEWHVADHMGQSYSKQVPNWHPKEQLDRMFDTETAFGVPPPPEKLRNQHGKQWVHINGLDYNGELDQIVMSLYITSELLVIDHSTTIQEASTNTGGRAGLGGRLLFRYGHKANPANGDLVIHGHAAHWLSTDYLRANMQPPPESYHQILMFINGVKPDAERSIQSQPASVLQITLPAVPTGQGYPVDTWGVPPDILVPVADTNRQFLGSAQLLPSGNFLVDTGQRDSVMMEVTAAGVVVWSQPRYFVYRAGCFAPSLFGLEAGGGVYES